MPLTDPAIRNAKPRERPYKLGDAGGLFLLVTPAGAKWWRLKYRFGGKAKLLSLGVYPEAGLKQARAKRDEARTHLAAGVDPSEARKAAKAARGGEDSLKAVAREWVAKHAPRWAPGHASIRASVQHRQRIVWCAAIHSAWLSRSWSLPGQHDRSYRLDGHRLLVLPGRHERR